MPEPLPPLHWRLPHGVRVAYSPAQAGDQRDGARRRDWLLDAGIPVACVVPGQVHGAALADARDPAALAGADGLYLPASGGGAAPALGVFGADCPGLVIAAIDGLAIAHCGWRGTAAGIVPALVAALSRISADPPSRWHAFIGPGIGGDGQPGAYEVDAPVLGARAWPDTALAPSSTPGRRYLDVSAAIAHDLVAAGLPAPQRSGICTWRDPRLHSYRHQGPGLVQLLAVWRTS